MAHATQADVEASLLRSLTAVEITYVDELLDRVERKLLTRIPDLDARLLTDPKFAALVADIEADAVARVFRNPTGMTQESDGTYSYNVNLMVASGLLDVLTSDWVLLGLDQPIQSLAGAMDGYARARYALPPSDQFQNGWPGVGDAAEVIL